MAIIGSDCPLRHALFESELLLDRGCTSAQLMDGFSRMMEWAKIHSGDRGARLLD
jgi:hypothetical protein